jgi:flavin reductase (DIM6/NTAB) family NADH-FMN oxidoreductase RutF
MVMSALPVPPYNNALPATRVIHPSILYVGTPVVLISTINPDGTANLSPMSSAWALRDRVVLGMLLSGQGCQNLLRTKEAVINVPDPSLHRAVEAIADTTGCRDVPGFKQAMGYRYVADKFALAGLGEAPSEAVAPPRVAQCPLQLEARLLAAHSGSTVDGKEADYVSLEMQVLRVHAHEDILCKQSDHIDTARWSPLLYVFRHYFGTGAKLGRNFRAET